MQRLLSLFEPVAWMPSPVSRWPGLISQVIYRLKNLNEISMNSSTLKWDKLQTIQTSFRRQPTEARDELGRRFLGTLEFLNIILDREGSDPNTVFQIWADKCSGTSMGTRTEDFSANSVTEICSTRERSESATPMLRRRCWHLTTLIFMP